MSSLKNWVRLIVKGPYQGLKKIASEKEFYRSIGISYNEVLRLKAAPYQLNTETSLFEKRIKINSPYWYLHGIQEIFIDKNYLFKSAKPNPLILDCGSNIGLSIIFFKKNFPFAKVIGFEPDPAIFSILKNNISVFDFTDVELNQSAIWTSETEMSFASDGGVGGNLMDQSGTSTNKGVVKTTRLRNLLEAQHVDFLKIDIDGAEYEVLRDCKDVIKGVDNIFVEYHSPVNEEQKLDELLSFFKEAGFRIYIKEAWNISNIPFVDRSKSFFDLQLNIFAYKQ